MRAGVASSEEGSASCEVLGRNGSWDRRWAVDLVGLHGLAAQSIDALALLDPRRLRCKAGDVLRSRRVLSVLRHRCRRRGGRVGRLEGEVVVLRGRVRGRGGRVGVLGVARARVDGREWSRERLQCLGQLRAILRLDRGRLSPLSGSVVD